MIEKYEQPDIVCPHCLSDLIVEAWHFSEFNQHGEEVGETVVNAAYCVNCDDVVSRDDNPVRLAQLAQLLCAEIK